jgi:hypothetical protein
MHITKKALLVLALHLNFTGVCASPAEDESGTFNFLWENDAIAGTDHHYTNGLELSYLSIEDHLWELKPAIRDAATRSLHPEGGAWERCEDDTLGHML